MEILDHNIYDYLVPNRDVDINCGAGYIIKEGTPESKVNEIREYHNERMNQGKPYFIIDFLAEDIKRGVKVERSNGGYRRKTQ